MASWVKSAFNSSYFQIGCIENAFVAQDINEGDVQWYIWGTVNSGGNVKLKGPYATQALAQTDLDNAIVTLGGSV